MIQLIQQAADLQHFVRVRQWRSCLIGGIAVIRWGEPRLTRDVDVTLFAEFGAEDSYVQVLLAVDGLSRRSGAAAHAARLAAIRSRLEPLVALKGEPEILERLATVRANVAR